MLVVSLCSCSRSLTRPLPLRLSVRSLIRINLVRPPNPPSTLAKNLHIISFIPKNSNPLRHPKIPIRIRVLMQILTRNPPRSARRRLIKPLPSLTIFILTIILRRIRVQFLTIANRHVQRKARVCGALCVVFGGVLGRRRRDEVVRRCEADLQVLDVFVGGDVRVGEVELEEHGAADLRVDCDCWVGDAGAVVGSWRPEGEVAGGGRC
jgi:hypothetical protein